MFFTITVEFIECIEFAGIAIVIASVFLISVASVDPEPKYSLYGIT